MAVALAGALAAALTLLDDKDKFHKSIVLVLIVLLTKTEYRAVRKDRWDSGQQALADRTVQNNQFAKVLRDQQAGFVNTLNGIDHVADISSNTLTKANEAIDTVTGGETFVYLMLRDDLGLGPLSWEKIGNAPLYDVSANLQMFVPMSTLEHPSIDYPPWQYRVGLLHFQIPTRNFGTGVTMAIEDRIIRIAPPETTSASIQMIVQFTARNGAWTEIQWVYNPPGTHKNLHATVIYKTGSQVMDYKQIWKRVDKGFPPDLMDDPVGTHDRARCAEGKIEDVHFCRDVIGPQWNPRSDKRSR